MALTYTAPVTEERDLIAVYGIDTNSDVASVGSNEVLGKGYIIGTRFIHPFQTGSVYQSLNFGPDFKNFKQTVLSDQAPDNTPIQYINWALQYSLTDHGARHDTLITAGFNFGLAGVVNKAEQFTYKRFDGRPDYSYLRLSVEHKHLLLWGTSLDLKLSGQLTGQPLISNEQFAIGGADTVRGYAEAFVLGDSGVAGSI